MGSGAMICVIVGRIFRSARPACGGIAHAGNAWLGKTVPQA